MVFSIPFQYSQRNGIGALRCCDHVFKVHFVSCDTPTPSLMLMPISAIVTAFQRVDETIETIQCLQACRPSPTRIVVHFDGGQVGNADYIRLLFPSIQVIVSDENVGPGGGRNKMIAAADSGIVASFDDDSRPIDSDFFYRLSILFEEHPDAAVINSQVFHRGESIVADERLDLWAADFSGGACAYRRDEFLRTEGYVPLPVAYGMEEVDLGLRLHAIGGKVMFSNWLRVYHDTDLARHSDPKVTAMSIANIALLVFLRYPITLWPYGFAQLLNRLHWLLRNGRSAGILRGFLSIPRHLWHNRGYRKVLAAEAVRSYLWLRRHPKPV
jgi:GT2 family glycosyltransferase